jgi:hypothetical protein
VARLVKKSTIGTVVNVSVVARHVTNNIIFKLLPGNVRGNVAFAEIFRTLTTGKRKIPITPVFSIVACAG